MILLIILIICRKYLIIIRGNKQVNLDDIKQMIRQKYRKFKVRNASISELQCEVICEVTSKKDNDYELIDVDGLTKRYIYQGENFYLPYESLDGQVKALTSFIRKRGEFLDEIGNQRIGYHEERSIVLT